MNDECFDSIEERCRYMAQVAKVPAMKNTLTSAADTIEAMTQARDGVKTLAIIYCEQLIASQAREQKLREALETIREVNIRFGMSVVAFDYALALPHDDTALNAWGAKLLREWVAHIMANGCTSAVTNMNRRADELEKK